MVGLGVGKRLFAVQPGIDSPLTGKGSCVEAEVSVGSGAWVSDAVLAGNFKEKVSVGFGSAVSEGDFSPDEQAVRKQANRKAK